jgi:beta-mannosidase
MSSNLRPAVDLIELSWQLGHSSGHDVMPEKWIKATVPGAANLDWGTAEGLPDWRQETNFEAYRWMEDQYWIYKSVIPDLSSDLTSDQRVFFTCKGIDYKYEILIGGELRYSYEGMFRPFELDVTEDLGSELIIAIHPVPKDEGAVPGSRQEARQSCKPAVSYGWDWHPRLIPLGIWDDTGIVVRYEDRIISAELLYDLSEHLNQADLCLDVDLSGEGDLEFTLYSPDSEIVLQSTGRGNIGCINDPLLWWCNGYGQPDLYRWELRLLKNGDIRDSVGGKIGFRTITLEMNEGAWSEPVGYPKSRSNAPITLKLNNVPIFAKGTNWVNPAVFPGTITKETYEPLLILAQEANMNLLRIWGGGIVNKDSFFEICDELGLMVWQEFPLACNNYRGSKEYLQVLEQEAEAIIIKLRKYTSLAFWCGGNELFNSWSKMTDQSHALRLLNKLCYELDPKRPYLPTSPLMGMAHGCYLFRYLDGREVFQAMPQAHYTAYTEFGVPSLSNLDCCLMISEQNKLFPLEENEITIAHHAFKAWGDFDSWACPDMIEDYFGKPSDLQQMIEWSQWLQSEGYKCIYEEARRQKPYCSMALNWCYNEPWPTLANNSLINYPVAPKPAYYAVAVSCRNQLISARIPKFAWRSGETFAVDLWLLNDGNDAAEAGQADVWLEFAGSRHFVMNWQYKAVPANMNLEGPTVRFKLPETIENKEKDKLIPLNAAIIESDIGSTREMKLIIECGELSSEYRLLLR